MTAASGRLSRFARSDHAQDRRHPDADRLRRHVPFGIDYWQFE